MPKIRGTSTRDVTRAVAILELYRRPYPHHGNTGSCSRTLLVWTQSRDPRFADLEALEMAHPRGFEPLTSAFGGQRSAILLFLLKQLYHRKLAERLAYRMSDMNLVIVFDA